jgi:hypothetical protein
MKLTAFGPASPLAPQQRTAGLSPSTYYRTEAARLRDMAASSEYHDVREGLLCIAREYDLLADQRDGLLHHRFGQPLRRPVMDDGYPSLDDRQDNSVERQRIG